MGRRKVVSNGRNLAADYANIQLIATVIRIYQMPMLDQKVVHFSPPCRLIPNPLYTTFPPRTVNTHSSRFVPNRLAGHELVRKHAARSSSTAMSATRPTPASPAPDTADLLAGFC
jgi:hypothetical protein